jgi:multidrug efflux system membrane fusion protein
MVLEVQRGATVIDEAAVQRGARGTFVYAVNGDRTVTLRPVSLGAGQNGQVAVLQGLKAQELVVIDGADRLSDGTAVELVGADGPALAGEEAPREKRKKKRDAGTPAAALDAPDA